MAQTFELTGDWDKIKNLFANLKNIFDESGRETLEKLGREGEKFAVNAIKNQTLNWAPLNPAYLKGKIDRGESHKIYVRSSSYFQAITSWVVRRNGVLSAQVGVRRTARERDSAGRFVKGGSKTNNPIADIAVILEYGSARRGIPPRPLWRPTAEYVHKYERQNRILRTILHAKLVPFLK